MRSSLSTVSPDRVRAYADMFGIALRPGDAEAMAAALAGGLAGLEPFRAIDLADIEPFVVFPIDRLPT
jgi:hypothetical protein